MKHLILTVTAALLSLPTFAQQTSSLLLSGDTLMTGSSTTIEVYDEVCKRSIGLFTVTGPSGQVQIGPLCLSEAGFMSIRKRKLPNTIWIGNGWLKPGDKIDP